MIWLMELNDLLQTSSRLICGIIYLICSACGLYVDIYRRKICWGSVVRNIYDLIPSPAVQWLSRITKKDEATITKFTNKSITFSYIKMTLNKRTTNFCQRNLLCPHSACSTDIFYNVFLPAKNRRFGAIPKFGVVPNHFLPP